MNDKTTTPTHALVGLDELERLVGNYFLLQQGFRLFEYLLSQSDYPLYLSAASACEVLGLQSETLEMCRKRRLIRPRIYRRQFLYSAYDLVALSGKLNRKRLRRLLDKVPKVVVE